MLGCQRKSLMRTDVRRREIWEWSDHTRLGKQGAEMARKQDCPTPARFLLTSLAFHGEIIHAKTKILRNGTGSAAYATCTK
jgi:hypothetical protein